MSITSERLKELKIERGYTNRQVCRAVYGKMESKDDKDIKRHPKEALYAQYEKGTSSPKYDDLIKFAKFYNVTTDYLLGASDFKNEGHISTKELTGLSNPAIEALQEYDRFGMVKLINYLFENEDFQGFMTRLNNLLMYQYIYSDKANILNNPPEKFAVTQYDTAKYALVSYFDKMIDDIYQNKAVEYFDYRNNRLQEQEEGGVKNGKHSGKTE